MSKKIKIELVIGLIITALIIFFSIKALGGLHPGKVLQSNINWGLTAVSIIIYVYANYIRGLAYTRGLDRNIDRLTSFQIVGIGHALNMVLPLHAGEGLRFAFFPDDYNAKQRTELLVIPAAADFVAIMILSILAVPFAGFKDPNILKALWILSFLCIGAGILFAIATLCIPRLHQHAKKYMNLAIVKMMFWVMLSWVLLLLSTWVGLVAFGFHWIQSVNMSLAVFAATNIINFIPASPGAIGLFEYGTILGLGGLGIDQSTALSAGLMLHLIQYISLLPLGTVLYAIAIHGKYGVALKKIWKNYGNKQ